MLLTVKIPEGGKFTGELKMKAYPYEERMAKSAEIFGGLNLKDESVVDSLEYLKRVGAVAKERFQGMDVKLANGETVSDLETLGYYKEGADILKLAGQKCLEGVTLDDEEKKL